MLEVIHLYPGYLQPNTLFNRLVWELETAKLQGSPYTAVVIDGIHNLFHQFPAIENYRIFWPQLYNLLRQWPLTVITTHTTLMVQHNITAFGGVNIDDKRSEPLRHALIQKTDFHLEVVRVEPHSNEHSGSQLDMFHRPQEYIDDPGLFVLSVRSALGQAIPTASAHMYWHREKLVLFQYEQEYL